MAKKKKIDPRSNPTLSGEWAQIILNSVADGVFTVDHDFRITWLNRAAETITGVAFNEAIGQLCCEVFRGEVCENGCVLRQSMKTMRPVVNQRVHILRRDGARLPLSISTAVLVDKKGKFIGGVETFRDLSTEEELRSIAEGKERLGQLLSRNGKMQKLFSLLPEIAANDATALILGASGTGKELVARAIHDLGPRTRQPFVPINMAAIPEALLESELFGHEAGAFTGAVDRREGAVTKAAGGTIFLDEIGEMPLPVQAKLLRFLENLSFTPLGGNKEKKVDLRVVAATNRDLQAMVAQKKFRQDLYYRLAVLKIELPPLRDRPEDIPLLADYLLDATGRLRGKAIAGFTVAAMKKMVRYSWPGNVRELQSAIEVAILLCPAGTKVKTDHLPREVVLDHRETPAVKLPVALISLAGRSLAEIEAAAIKASLLRHNGRKDAVAAELGIHRVTLYRRIKALGLTLEAEEE